MGTMDRYLTYSEKPTGSSRPLSLPHAVKILLLLLCCSLCCLIYSLYIAIYFSINKNSFHRAYLAATQNSNSVITSGVYGSVLFPFRSWHSTDISTSSLTWINGAYYRGLRGITVLMIRCSARLPACPSPPVSVSLSAYLCQSTYHRRDHPPSELNRPRAIMKFSNVHAVRSDVPVELKPIEMRTLLSKRQLQFTIRRLTDLAASVGPTEIKYDRRKSAVPARCRASTKSRWGTTSFARRPVTTGRHRSVILHNWVTYSAPEPPPPDRRTLSVYKKRAHRSSGFIDRGTRPGERSSAREKTSTAAAAAAIDAARLRRRAVHAALAGDTQSWPDGLTDAGSAHGHAPDVRHARTAANCRRVDPAN